MSVAQIKANAAAEKAKGGKNAFERFGRWLGGFFPSVQSRRNTQDTINANKELAKYQYDESWKQLLYMNDYNLPINQKQRLIDAGLNPALMYGSAPQNTQTQMAKYNAPNVDYSQIKHRSMDRFLGTLSMFQDIAVKAAHTNNLKAQKENIEMDTMLKASSTGSKLASTAKTKFDLHMAKQLEKYSIDNIDQRNKLLKQQTINQEKYEKVLEQEIKKREAQVGVVKADHEIRKAEAKLAKYGVFRGDPIWYRFMLKMITSGGSMTIKEEDVKKMKRQYNKGSDMEPNYRFYEDPENDIFEHIYPMQ